MSYVRWSSDDFKSDFYIYSDVKGYVHLLLAGSRFKEPREKNPYDFVTQPEEYITFSDSQRTDIDLPGAGESYRFDDLNSCTDMCEKLIDIGYVAPDWMISRLRGDVQGG